MEHTKTTFKHPGNLDSEIWEWLKEHGTEETKQIIMMTARHFAGFTAGPINDHCKMNTQDRKLLIKDLCARLPYWPHIKTEDDDDAYIVGLDDTEEGLFDVHILEDGDDYDTTMSVEDFKPYLRPMSSMTDAEKKTLNNILEYQYYSDDSCMCEASDWLSEHHFDYRRLIEKGLALEAPKGMYKTE